MILPAGFITNEESAKAVIRALGAKCPATIEVPRKAYFNIARDQEIGQVAIHNGKVGIPIMGIIILCNGN